MKYLAFFLVALLPFAGQADTIPIRDADQNRLSQFDLSFGIAIQEALAVAAQEEISILIAALRGKSGPIAPEGDWLCRTIKIGGISPLVTYRPFNCRITMSAPGEYDLEKRTGSQRMLGTLRDNDGYFIYQGVGYVGDAPALQYTDFPEANAPIQPGQTIPQIGIFIQTGPDQARLMLPDPILESRFDILHLTR